MPWCPKCKNEYVEGIKECADCKIPLVDELPAEEDDKEDIQLLTEMRNVSTENSSTENSSIENSPTENSSIENTSIENTSPETEKPNRSLHYENYHDKAENFKSSAYTLIIVGILGIVALILIELEVLPIHLVGASKYMTNIVMGALFVIFLVCGFRSVNTYKKYEKEAILEDERTKEIKEWIANNVDGNEIEQKVSQIQQDLTEEIKYFYCFSALKDLIVNQFPGLDEAYLDNLAEEEYPALFEHSTGNSALDEE